MVRGGLSAVVTLCFALVLGCVGVGCGSAVPSSAASASEGSCGDAVLRDWADGAIDGVYSANCYLAAIESLPEDVRAYSSAEDDITRALQSRGGGRPSSSGAGDAASEDAPSARQLSAAAADPAQPSASSSLRLPPVPVLVLVAIGVVLAAAGATASLGRRARRGR